MKWHEVSAAAATATAATAATPSMESSLLDKVATATEGLSPNCFHHLYNMFCSGGKGKENALMICDHIFSKV
jgi:hypothetical protein